MDTLIVVLAGAGVILGVILLVSPRRSVRLPFFLSILAAAVLSIVRNIAGGVAARWTDVLVVIVLAVAAALEAIATVLRPADRS